MARRKIGAIENPGESDSGCLRQDDRQHLYPIHRPQELTGPEILTRSILARTNPMEKLGGDAGGCRAPRRRLFSAANASGMSKSPIRSEKFGGTVGIFSR